MRANGETVVIFPDNTASVAKARRAFTEVRKLLCNCKDVRYGILFPARLCIAHDKEDKEFKDADEAMRYVKKKILPATEGRG